MEQEDTIRNTIDKLFNAHTNNYIFVYTPPKVGSTTLVSSLRISLGKSYNVIHIHDEVMLSVLTGINNVKINDIIFYLAKNGKKVYVIDVYRTPIERKISEFFEKISQHHFNNTEENINKYSIKRVSDRFNKLFPHLENGDHYLDRYDIAEPIGFDFNAKYTIQEYNNVNYIKLRLCDSESWSTILSTIFSEDIVLITDYKTDGKAISSLYNKFKQEYKLPLNYFEDIKSCKYLNFYYNEEERNKYLNLWRDKTSDVCVPYTKAEYNFYLNLCLENQHINDIQTDHYIDNGCFCVYCTNKRREIYFKAKNGEKIFEKIIHSEIINEVNQTKNKQIIERLKKNGNAKYTKNQFSIRITNL
jgi:hypothetical protein